MVAVMLSGQNPTPANGAWEGVWGQVSCRHSQSDPMKQMLSIRNNRV